VGTTEGLVQQGFGKSGSSVLRRHICGESKFGSPHQHLWWKSPPSPSPKPLAANLADLTNWK